MAKIMTTIDELAILIRQQEVDRNTPTSDDRLIAVIGFIATIVVGLVAFAINTAMSVGEYTNKVNRQEQTIMQMVNDHDALHQTVNEIQISLKEVQVNQQNISESLKAILNKLEERK